jgi:hypothetical protein
MTMGYTVNWIVRDSVQESKVYCENLNNILVSLIPILSSGDLGQEAEKR